MFSAKQQLVYGFIFLLKFASSLLDSTKDSGRVLTETYAEISASRTLAGFKQRELKCSDLHYYNESSSQCESCLLVCQNNSTLFNATLCRTRCTALSGLEELRRTEKKAFKLHFIFDAVENDSKRLNQSFQGWKTKERGRGSYTESLIHWLKSLTIAAYSLIGLFCLLYWANAFCRPKTSDHKVDPAKIAPPTYAKLPPNDVITTTVKTSGKVPLNDVITSKVKASGKVPPNDVNTTKEKPLGNAPPNDVITTKVKRLGEVPPEDQRCSDLDKLKKVPPLGDCEVTDEPFDT